LEAEKVISMQVALTIWQGRISPLFDTSRRLLIAQIEQGRVIAKRYEPFDCESAFSRAARLHDLGIDLLICGGISDLFANLIDVHGIEIIPFAAGAVDEILQACLNGNIDQKRFRMPGCESGSGSPSRKSKISPLEGKEMKIAVTSSGPTLDDRIEARFGRCPYFVLVDANTLQFESIPNPNLTLGGGAGIQSAQLMATKGVTVVLTGHCGPNAFQTFGAAGIQVVTGVGGVVREAVEQFTSGQLASSSAPTTQGHLGKGLGRGMGMKRNQMAVKGLRPPAGMGAGVTDQAAVSSDALQTSVPVQSDLDLLKQQASHLRRQLEELEGKIEAISEKH
jgi:predicted Fe-Mo cluster-binding NifX family protein